MAFHSVWIQGEASAPKENVSAWKALHPGAEFTVWDDASIRSLLEESYPELMHRYTSAISFAQAKDVASFAIVHAKGGLFLDMDFQPRRSVAPLLEGRPLIAVKYPCGVGAFDRRNVTVSVFGGAAGHPTLARAVALIAAYPDRGRLQLRSSYISSLTKCWTKAVTGTWGSCFGTADQFMILPETTFYTCGSRAEAWKCMVEPTGEPSGDPTRLSAPEYFYAISAPASGSHTGVVSAYYAVVRWCYDNKRGVVAGLISVTAIALLLILVFSSRCAKFTCPQ